MAPVRAETSTNKWCLHDTKGHGLGPSAHSARAHDVFERTAMARRTPSPEGFSCASRAPAQGRRRSIGCERSVARPWAGARDGSKEPLPWRPWRHGGSTAGQSVRDAVRRAVRHAARSAKCTACTAPWRCPPGSYGSVGGRRRIAAGASGSGSSIGRRFASSRATWRQRWRTKSIGSPTVLPDWSTISP